MTDTYQQLPNVATHTPDRRPRRRRRWAAGLGTAGAVAATVVVSGLGGGTVVSPAPAYAVDVEDDGDVVVTINRLRDARGAQADLRDAGVDATVRYNPIADLLDYTIVSDPDGPDLSTYIRYAAESPPCRGADAATLSRSGAGWELRIAAGSPAQDRPVWLSVSVDAELLVTYLGDTPGVLCTALTSA